MKLFNYLLVLMFFLIQTLNADEILNLGKEISDKEWDEFVYLRSNPIGKHLELWHHVAGCRQWFKVSRDTVTHKIFETIKLNEKL